MFSSRRLKSWPSGSAVAVRPLPSRPPQPPRQMVQTPRTQLREVLHYRVSKHASLDVSETVSNLLKALPQKDPKKASRKIKLMKEQLSGNSGYERNEVPQEIAGPDDLYVSVHFGFPEVNEKDEKEPSDIGNNVLNVDDQLIRSLLALVKIHPELESLASRMSRIALGSFNIGENTSTVDECHEDDDLMTDLGEDWEADLDLRFSRILARIKEEEYDIMLTETLEEAYWEMRNEEAMERAEDLSTALQAQMEITEEL